MPTPSKRKADVTALESPRSSKRLRAVKSKVEEESPVSVASPSPSRTKRIKATAKVEVNGKKTVIAEVEKEEPISPPAAKKKEEPRKKATAKAEVAVVDRKSGELETAAAKKQKTPAKPKRKPKAAATENMPPLAPRTQALRMLVGAHVSAAGGVPNSIPNAVHIGANSLALFLKSQRKWANPPLSTEHRDDFRSACSTHSYSTADHILPHGSYLVNLAQSEPEKRKQAYDCFLDDLKRCDSLGIRLYNFHPGSTGGAPRQEALARIADAINASHKETQAVVPVLENMAGGSGGTGEGNTIGSSFEDLRDIIQLVHDKSRVGVCLDTCHAFAAGHDLRTPAAFSATMEKFERIVGVKYLRALHLNDSKAPFSSGRDLHANIGTGFLGLRAFHCVMNEKRFEGLPMVLETPIDEEEGGGFGDGGDKAKDKDKEEKKATKKKVEDKGVWAREIKLLEGLIGMDAKGEEFRALEKELAGRGAGERARVGGQAERSAAKAQSKKMKKGAKGGGKKKKGGEDEDEDEDDSEGR